MRRLAAVAQGTAPADLVLTGGALVNVFTEEIQTGWGVAVAGGRVAFVGPDAEVAARAGEGSERIDLAGDLVAPGLIEGHTHLTRVRVSDMMDRQVACGVTTTIVESQELSFIVGPEGARVFLDEAERVAGRLFYTVSGLICIDPELDARLRAEDWVPLLDHPRVVGLGEIYWADLLRGHPRTEALIEAALRRGLAVEGHGAGARVASLHALAAFGVGSDHEGTNADETLARLRAGLIAFARHGATRQDVEAIAALWRDHRGLDLSRLGLVSDGVEPDVLDRGETLNAVVERVVQLGLPLPRAVRMASRTVAEHFGLGRWLGGLSPGMLADLVVVPREGGFRPRLVLVGGRRPEPSRPSTYPDWMLDTVCVPDLPAELLTRPPAGRWRAIQFRGPLVTVEVESDGRSDLVCTVVDRDGGSRGFRGLLRGFGLRDGAAAISSGWECPGVLMVGDRPQDMAIAVRRLRDLRGGAVVTSRGRVLAEYAAPVAGLYSTEPMATVVERVTGVNRALRELGCDLPNPILSLEVLTTGAIPFLRIWAGGYRRLRDGALLGLAWEEGR
ncbi:MAG TPA: adenine deaminase C-terminal domain-containing protein [Candidatus Dormibacteraeota bacterium]|nr:adenine deaminase C-terminal domain-containing protein [Candidatus Dormibacteraeota bacterium]